MKKFISWQIPLIILIALLLGFYDLPGSTQQNIIPFTPESVTKTSVNLGLDLQGGSQLDYKIDLRKVPESDQEDIKEGVKGVIEKRVNSLGVAEPNIYISELAGESHIIVELAETAAITQEDVDAYLGGGKVLEELSDDEQKLVSLEKAKATVGKTIQLEFKEEKDSLDPQEKDKIKENAQQALDRIIAGDDFSVVGQEEKQAYPGKVTYEKSTYKFENEINSEIYEVLETLEIGEYSPELIETGGSFTIDESGEAVEETALTIVKLLDEKEEVKNDTEVDVSHILISWAGLDNADASITRDEDEAYDLVKEIENKLDNGEDFAALAKEYSDDKSNSEDGGVLSAPVTGDGTYVYDFEQAALDLEEGTLSDIVKTKFGYHLIKADEVRTNATYPQYQYEMISFSTKPDPWKETGLYGKHFVHADVQLDQFYQPYVQIQFNEEGARLFEEITERNVQKKVAIFVGGELISAPTVQEKISGGSAQITGSFTTDEAKELARDLNTGAIPAPIILTGEYTIGATLGHEALSKSLMAGLIGLLIVMVFMVLVYKLSGLIADLALAIYAILLIFLIKSQLPLSIAITVALVIFIFLIVKIVNNRDSGWEKLLSFLLSCFAFFFLTFVLKTGVVLTLAGVAGIILSIGMAVDANILIFERIKEELRNGKTYGSAVESGFARAWSAIRDSNFSTLLTCAILFYFGSSIIRGFAFNLAAGVLVSMFTAITITRTFLRGFIGKKLAQNPKAFAAGTVNKAWNFKIIKRSKTWLTLSGLMVGISLFAIVTLGLNYGIDFTGGTLLEFKFDEPVEKSELEQVLTEIGEEINSENPTPTAAIMAVAYAQDTDEEETLTAEEPEEEPEEEPAEETTEETTSEDEETTTITPTETSLEELNIEQDETTAVDLSGMQIIEAGENSYIVKTKYLSTSAHDQIVKMMKDKLPNFVEPRFTTIGPVLGKTLLHKAIIAIVFALIMIIIYIGFAFRKIPKEVSPWKFGACAIAALLHDVIIITGIFTILSTFLNIEIDALFITAMLTVFGYSVNDTIVIFDRIRENLINHSRDESIEKLTDKALNETMVRSINTSLSTLITLITVLVLGSSSIFYFVLALTLGTLVGTYSSIFTASPLMILWNKKAMKKAQR